MSCQARNVGVGGMFLVTDSAPELLSKLAISVTLPGGTSATLGARVVHVLGGQKARSAGTLPGVGVQFDGLDSRGQAFVRELVAWARARDPRPRIARRKPGVDPSTLQHEPMLGFLLSYVDGKRDPEALAEELALELDTIERMLAELARLGAVELTAAGTEPNTSQRTAATVPSIAKSKKPLSPVQQDDLDALESRSKSGDHYELLGVPASSNSEQAREAFLKRNAELHPSIRPADEAERIERVLGRMREAASVLSSSERKDEYDQYRERAEWLAAAESLRGRGSIPPPPPEPSECDDAPVNLKLPPPPADVSRGKSNAPTKRPPTAVVQPATREPSARARAAAAALRRPSRAPSASLGLPPSAASRSPASAPSRSLSPATQPPPRTAATQPPPAVQIAAAPTQPPPANARHRASRGPSGASRSTRPPRPSAAAHADAAAQAAAAQAAAAAALTSRGRPSVAPARPSKPVEVPLGAAAQILAQAEAAYGAGQANEARRHLQLLSAMSFDDPQVQARFVELKTKVMRTAAVDFEKQAAYEEKQQHWAQAARSWRRVVEGRPNDSYPLQRLALAQLQVGTEVRAAMENAKRAVELAPNDAQAHRTLAKVYIAADMQASARRELEAAQRCAGTSESSEEGTPTGLLKRLLGRDDEA